MIVLFIWIVAKKKKTGLLKICAKNLVQFSVVLIDYQIFTQIKRTCYSLINREYHSVEYFRVLCCSVENAPECADKKSPGVVYGITGDCCAEK